jgi:hypothetical protein
VSVITEIIKTQARCKDKMINDKVRVDERRKQSRGGTVVCSTKMLD